MMPQSLLAPEQREQMERRPNGGRPREFGIWGADANPVQAPVAWGWLTALTALAIVLRAVALNQQLWFDEIMTLLDSVRAPMWQIITHYAGQNQHMLYSVLAHGSIRLLGE